MPFGKRQLTWSEEVFAGLIILVLLVIGISVWFFVQTRNTPTLSVEEENSGPANIATLDPQEREQAADTMGAQLAEQSSPSPLTNEEKLQIANTPSQ